MRFSRRSHKCHSPCKMFFFQQNFAFLGFPIEMVDQVAMAICSCDSWRLGACTFVCMHNSFYISGLNGEEPYVAHILCSKIGSNVSPVDFCLLRFFVHPVT